MLDSEMTFVYIYIFNGSKEKAEELFDIANKSHDLLKYLIAKLHFLTMRYTKALITNIMAY